MVEVPQGRILDPLKEISLWALWPNVSPVLTDEATASPRITRARIHLQDLRVIQSYFSTPAASMFIWISVCIGTHITAPLLTPVHSPCSRL